MNCNTKMSIPRIRKGKSFEARWAITTNMENVPLDGRDLRLELRDPLQRATVMPFKIEDSNVIVFRFNGTSQERLGVYALTLWENRNKEDQSAVDYCDAFELVRCTCDEGVGGNMEIDCLDLQGANMTVGIHGTDALIVKQEYDEDGNTVLTWNDGVKTVVRKGKDGYTPQKGVDYWTPEEETEINKAKADAIKATAETLEAKVEAETATENANDSARVASEKANLAKIATDNANESARKADVATENANAKMAEFDAQEVERQQEEQARKVKEVVRETAEVARSQSEVLREEAENARKVAFNQSQQEREAQFSASNVVWDGKVNNVVAEAQNAVRDAENAKQTVISSLDKYIGSPISDVTVIL